MRLTRCGVDILVVFAALLFTQLPTTTVVNADSDEEQTARDWLEQYYRVAEDRYFSWVSASWDFNVNITAENNRRLVSTAAHRPPVTQRVNIKH